MVSPHELFPQRGIVVPEFTGQYTQFERPLVNPPEQHQNYLILPYEASVDAILTSELPPGKKLPLLGLLSYGGVVEFPGGVGLDYKAPFKVHYMPEYASPAAQMIAEEVKKTQANLLVAPDIAPLLFAGDIASRTNNIGILRMQKDGKQGSAIGFEVPSYTKGFDASGQKINDVMYFDIQSIQHAFDRTGRIKLYIVEDIIDTGQMIRGIMKAVKYMQEQGLPIEVCGVGVFTEKTYTNGRALIQQELDVPITAAIQVEDIWTADPHGKAGMKVVGIDQALTFRQQAAA